MPPLRHVSSLVLYGALLLLLAGACAVSLVTGSVHLAWSELLRSPGTLHLRAARTAMAAVAGAGLSAAGAIFQALLRNPLAEPYVLGVTAGAGLGAAVAIVAGLSAAGMWTVPGLAFLGALGTIILVQALSRTPSGATPAETMLLAGVTVSAVLNSLLMFLVYTAPSTRLGSVVWWLLGNLEILDWPPLIAVAALVTLGLAAAIFFANDLNLLALGDETAAHLGLDVGRSRFVFFAIASLVTGAVVATCGIIGFVGLIVPHAVRLLLGPDNRRLLPTAALSGAAFLILADCAARTVLASREIPIGVVTALAGGPLFLVLLRRRKMTQL